MKKGGGRWSGVRGGGCGWFSFYFVCLFVCLFHILDMVLLARHEL